MPVAEPDPNAGNPDAVAHGDTCYSNSHSDTNTAHTNTYGDTHTDPNSNPDAERHAGRTGDQPVDADERSDGQ